MANTTAPNEDWIGKYIPSEDVSTVETAVNEAIRTRSLFALEHRVHLVPLLRPDGATMKWFGAASDVTERRLASARLEVNLGEGAQSVLAERLQEIGVPLLFFTGYDRDVIPQSFAEVERPETPVGHAAAQHGRDAPLFRVRAL